MFLKREMLCHLLHTMPTPTCGTECDLMAEVPATIWYHEHESQTLGIAEGKAGVAGILEDGRTALATLDIVWGINAFLFC